MGFRAFAATWAALGVAPVCKYMLNKAMQTKASQATASASPEKRDSSAYSGACERISRGESHQEWHRNAHWHNPRTLQGIPRARSAAPCKAPSARRHPWADRQRKRREDLGEAAPTKDQVQDRWAKYQQMPPQGPSHRHLQQDYAKDQGQKKKAPPGHRPWAK